MTYINPRLKHVKEIKEICDECLLYDISVKNLILDQCNLLLETKKAKKRKCVRHSRPSGELTDCCETHHCSDCFMYPTPDPKEESKKTGSLVTDCCGTEDFDPWGFDRGDGTYDERCGKCGKKTDVNWKEYPTPSRSEEPKDPKTTLKEIEELYMDGDFGDIPPRNEEITFKLNQVIYAINKLIKSK